MSGTEGLILCGLEKKIMEYLAAHPDDRFLTSNRLSLALGSNEILVLNALKALTKTHLVSERVDSSMSMTTYRAYERPSDSVAIQTPKVVTPRPTVTEKRLPESSIPSTEVGTPKLPTPSPTIAEIRAMFQKGYQFSCKLCANKYDKQAGLSAHMNRVHKVIIDMDAIYAELDREIKKSYPRKGPREIAKELGLNTGIISSRLTKMHKSGEIKEYWNRKAHTSYPLKSTEPAKREVTPLVSHETEAISKPNSFNIGQLLKVNSENQVAVVNATLEVIDERGSEYEVTLKRTNRGLGLILSSQMLAQLIDTLKYRVEEINDISEDAERDDLDWFQDLMEEQYLCESIIEKIRKDTRIPEEKEAEHDPKST
jgi:hypothetical protein